MLPAGPSARSQRLATACALIVVAAGLIIFSGWLFGIPRFTDWFGTGISMMPNAAIAIGLSGLALLLRNMQRRNAVIICAGIAGAIGLLTFCQHIFKIDLGIDQLLIKTTWGHRGTTSPGRMGLPASFMLFLYNFSLIVSTFGYEGRRNAARGAAICIGISLLSVIGYLYEADRLYVIPELTAISMTTALIFIILGSALIASLTDVQPMRTLKESSAAGAIVRRALPIIVVLPVLVGWLRLKGHQLDLYDMNFGVALGAIVEVSGLVVLLWWLAGALGRHELSQRKMEADLRLSENRYHTFIKQSSEGIWRCELTEPIDISLPVDKLLDLVYERGYMAECNDAMARMYGYEQGQELIGAKLQDLLPRTPENEAYLKAFIASGFNLHGGESIEIDKLGRAVYFSNNLVGIVEDGKVLRAWGTQQDITARRATEEALREADKRKDEFLATLAHELRNPLSPLVSGVELLASGVNADPAAEKEVHQMMQRQLQHMVRLIDDLMDVSRINRGKIALRFEQIELASVLNMALESSRPFFEQCGHRVEISLPADRLIIKGDPVRLAQVFLNVLNNAAKYTAKGGLIQIRSERSGNVGIVSIKDNGIGLQPEHYNSIFEMFGQVDRSTARSYSGLGIGLALVKRLVEDHGGSVEAFSEGLGKGTTISIKLPLHAVEQLVPVQDQLAAS